MIRGKKQEIGAIRRELIGEREVRLSRLSPDSGTDEGEKRRQLIWQNFRIRDGTGTNGYVLGEAHPNFVEGKEAAAGNSAELFESELYQSPSGVHVDRLSNIHAHYFGGGFEKIVGLKLRAFVKEKYEYDEKTGVVKAPMKMLNALRKLEARNLIEEEKLDQERKKYKAMGLDDDEG
eukprot:CAMPEP_0117554550 /NCGR_PEP_ID=MMETSP0784-20121206/50813_1 /TAXON_ID=39447 /ORGANISM="" /LENGTH=176 /DNA_ID=CAMNT_0005351721 /DNA_START=86 /DNA_END=613 /DNA_ORIENTATION=-